MNVYESIMKGLSEALDYEKGGKTARTETVSITSILDMSASDEFFSTTSLDVEEVAFTKKQK